MVQSFEIEPNYPMIDFDFYQNESCILVGFTNDNIFKINMGSNESEEIELNLNGPLS